MRLEMMLLLASLFSLLAGKGIADAPSLNIYEFARSDRFESSQYDLRTIITFYPDGLIHTLAVTSYTIATRKEKAERSFEVTRKGDVISQTYTKKETKASDVTYQLGADVVSIHYSNMKPSDVVTLQRTQGSNERETTCKYLVNGKLRYEFKLTPKENVVATLLRMGRTTYTITLDQARGLPSVVCEGVTQSKFEIGKIGPEKYSILYKDPDGPLLASYRVEGTLRSFPPLIAVLNFLIYGNLIDGPAVYPFIGGMPSF